MYFLHSVLVALNLKVIGYNLNVAKIYVENMHLLKWIQQLEHFIRRLYFLTY